MNRILKTVRKLFSTRRRREQATAKVNLLTLPDEMLLKIVAQLSIFDLHHFSMTCKRFQTIASDKSLKTTIFHQEDLRLPEKALMRYWDSKTQSVTCVVYDKK